MKPAKEIIMKCLKNLNPTSVLDLGCGKGKFSLFFSGKGINVTGVDKEDLNITPNNFNFIQKDIKDFEFEKRYDLIIASMVLHFFKKEEAIEIIEKMKRNTSANGFNFLICMSEKDDCAKRNPNDFYINVDELSNLYIDWKIIKNELCFSKKHTDGKNSEPHHHKIIIFLVQKKN